MHRLMPDANQLERDRANAIVRLKVMTPMDFRNAPWEYNLRLHKVHHFPPWCKLSEPP